MEIMLQRSGDLELDVKIQYAQQWSELDYDWEQLEEWRACIHCLIRLLLPTTARWRQLFIASSRDVFDALTGCSFERLRSLDVYWDGDEDKAVIALFRHTTKLAELKLQCQYELDIDLPWTGIRTFSAGCSGLLYLPSMLGLQDLHIVDGCETLDRITSKWDGIQSFELPLLRSITVLDLGTSRVIYELSRHLRAPSLTTLVLHMWNYVQANSPALPPRLPVFDNLDSLVNLSIHFMLFEVTHTISFLTRTSSVTNLYIGPNTASPAIMAAIGHGVVPRLQTLGLHFSTWQKSPDAVISMLTRRALNRPPAGPIANLRFVQFGPDDEISLSSRERMEGWDEWLSMEALRVQEGTAARWDVARENTDVQIVERYSFEL